MSQKELSGLLCMLTIIIKHSILDNVAALDSSDVVKRFLFQGISNNWYLGLKLNLLTKS